MKKKSKKKTNSNYDNNNSLSGYFNLFKQCINNEEHSLSKRAVKLTQLNNLNGSLFSKAYVLDYTSNIIKKRKMAYNKYVKKLVSDCGFQIMDKEEQDRLEDCFANLIAYVPIIGLNALDINHSITYIIAVWILEQLVKKNKLDTIFPYCSSVNKKYTNVKCHPFLSSQLISATIDLIENRNGDKYRNNKFGNLYHEISNKEKQDIQNTEDRLKWNSVLSLLGEDIIEDAVKYFKDKSWDLIKKEVLFSYNISKVQNKAIDDFANQEDLAIETMLNFLIKNNPEYINKFNKTKECSKIFLISSCKMINKEFAHNICIDMVKKERETDDINDVCHKIAKCDFSVVYQRDEAIKMSKGLIPEEISNNLKDFKVEDLGKIAFAALYLLDIDDPFVWLYNGTIALLKYGLHNSYIPKFSLYFDINECNDNTCSFPLINEDSYSYMNLYNSTKEYMSDKIALAHEANELFNKAFDFEENTLQILSHITDFIPGGLSFNTTFCKNIIDKLFENKNEKEKEYIYYILQLYININCKDNLPSFEQYQIEQLKKENENLKLDNQNCTCDSQAEKDQTAAEIKKLNERIKDLESQLYNANKSIKDITNKKDEINKENEWQKQELGRLREFAYNSQNKTVYETKEKNAIQFPYNSLGINVVSYGGHKSWLQKMRALLPSVTFVDADNLPNPSLFKGADAIWLQSNKMGHAQFYTVINIARKNNIPIYYFSAASAQKCAEQFVSTIT